jgi:hypothetical protein
VIPSCVDIQVVLAGISTAATEAYVEGVMWKPHASVCISLDDSCMQTC